MGSIRIVVADDHPIVHEGYRRVLDAVDGADLVGACHDGDSLLECCRRLQPDLLILDSSMPGPRVFELLRELKHELPALQVLVYSDHREADYAVPCLQVGAAGYVSKDRPIEELIEGIECAARGERYVATSLGTRIAERVLRGGAEPEPHQRLSPREFEIFVLLGEGLSVGQIASRLDISPKTVSTHRANICRKTGLGGNGEIVRYVVERSLA